MTTAIGITIYLGYAAYRVIADRNERARVKANEAVWEARTKKLELRLTAIEAALKASPFITFGGN